MDSRLPAPIAEETLPFSHGLLLVRDSASAPVLNGDSTKEFHELGVAATESSAAVITMEDALEAHVSVFKGAQGCLHEIRNHYTRVFRLVVPTRKLIIQQIINSDIEEHPFTAPVEGFPGDDVRIVVTQQMEDQEMLAMHFFLLTDAEYLALAPELPPLIGQNYVHPPPTPRLSKEERAKRRTPLTKALFWFWKLGKK